MTRYLCLFLQLELDVAEWLSKLESTPVENDSVLTNAPRDFFTWEYSMERKHEVVRNAREKLKSLIQARKKEVKMDPFFGLRSVIEFEDVVILGRSSVTVLLLVDKDQAYRGHVYLYPGPSSRATTMKGIRTSVQNLLCLKPIEKVGKLLAQAAQQVCMKLCSDYDARETKKTSYLCVDAPCGPMPQILFDLGFRAYTSMNSREAKPRPEKIESIGYDWFKKSLSTLCQV